MKPAIKKNNNNDPKQQRIAIIGAGVAGVGMAGALMDHGIEDFTVFEKNGKVGGLWADNYPGASGKTVSEAQPESFSFSLSTSLFSRRKMKMKHKKAFIIIVSGSSS